ncbi:hypothetical protein Ate02nite_43490 [Paractinoplanes tereljensis]|uniref:NACHT domain-containing protein n=1 Tax=Paractinoplanes tereljensis TaxID=571912 RepID=A0A919TTT9_9ACTN|nr:hypothetical protein Ate02nite_43490 [Actinoplanes tereljensis]
MFQHLTDTFGADRVFLDISLPGGSEWPSRLRDEVTAAPVVLVLIGPEWLKSTDEWSRRRIDSETDWVRQEMQLALDEPGKLVIPVLLGGADLPPKAALPDAVSGIADRQSRTLSHAGWRWQVDAVTHDVERHTGWRRRNGAAARPDTTIEDYTRGQRRRAETALSAGAVVIPDLLPFHTEPPATDRLTPGVAQQVRRAVKDRARYNTESLLYGVKPRRIVVLGGPGCGKTTLLNMITRAHAGTSLAEPAAALTPVLLRVRDLALHGSSLTAEAVGDVQRWFDLELDREFFDEIFRSGRGLLLVDGVDEAPSVSKRKELLAKVDLFADRYPNATIVVSSRIVGYDPRPLAASFEHFELAPFSTDQVKQFLAGAIGPGESTERLAKRIMKDSRISALAESPLLLSIIARIIVERGTIDRLPRERHALYDIAVEMLLNDWDSDRGIVPAERPGQLDRGEIRQALETVAYRIHAGLLQPGSTSVVESATLEYELTTALTATMDPGRARWAARDLLRYAVGRAGLLVESGPGQFAFGHRALQEHLAACAINARSVLDHLTEHGIHSAEWRNVNLLAVSMQRGDQARRTVAHILDAGSPYEDWLRRDHLFAGEILGESPSLLTGLDDELIGRIVEPVIDLFVLDRNEFGDNVPTAAAQVFRSWRSTPVIDVARRYLDRSGRHSSLVWRLRAEALVGDRDSARDALIDLVVSGDVPTADEAANALHDFHDDADRSPGPIARLVDSIPHRITQKENEKDGGPYFRLPYTMAETAAAFAGAGEPRARLRALFIEWIDYPASSECRRGVAATGLGWLGDNLPEVRTRLVRMLLDRDTSADARSWPAYALNRLGGGDPEVVEAMLTTLANEAPILCGWAEVYLGRFATRFPAVVERLASLAEDRSRDTLPWVLAASARLSGLKRSDIEYLEFISLSDTSLARRVGAINTLVECTQPAPEWRRHAASHLARALESFISDTLTDDDDDAVTVATSALFALGRLRVSTSEAWNLCCRLLGHQSSIVRYAATRGIGGLPGDTSTCSKIVATLELPEIAGKVRGGLVDALFRVHASVSDDTPGEW